MTTNSGSRASCKQTIAAHPLPTGGAADAVPKTMADVLAHTLANTSLTARQRNDRASALRSVAKLLDKPLEALPAQPRLLRQVMEKVSYTAAGMSKARWQNVRSLVGKAIAEAGATEGKRAGTEKEPLSPEWEALFGTLGDRMMRFRLSRFIRFCSREGIAPVAVDDDAFDRFREGLDATDLKNDPRQVARTACQYWNKAAETTPGWPQQRVTVPNYTSSYAVPWSCFPTSLTDEIDAWLHRLSGADPLGGLPFRPLRPSSIATRRRQMHEFVSALVRAGYPPESLTCMADLVDVDRVKAALRFIIGRKQEAVTQKETSIRREQLAHPTAANVGSVQAQHLARLICSIARHHVKVPVEHQNALNAVCHTLERQTQPALTERNRAKLRQFDDPEAVGRMMLVPARLMKGLSRIKPPTRKDALRVQTAVAIEIEQMVPMRLKNLVSLELGRHLRRLRNGGMHLNVPMAEVKNSFEINAPLQPETVGRITLYLEHFRPVLAGPEVPWLFPGKNGRAKSTDQMRAQIVAAVRELEGFDVTPHFARHFGAKHYLDANPGEYGVVRLVLGHKSVNTTTKYYADTETAPAMRLFGEHVVRMRRAAEARAAEKQGHKASRGAAPTKARQSRTNPARSTRKPPQGEG